MKITIAGYTHVIIAILLLTYSIAVKDTIGLGLSLSLILLLYYSYHQLRAVVGDAERISIERSVGRRVYTELEKADLRLTIINKSKRGFPRIVLIDELPKYLLLTEGKPVFTISLKPGSITNLIYEATVTAPGKHELGRIHLLLSDLLGYFYETITLNVPESFTALPLQTPSEAMVKSMNRIIGVYVKGKSTTGLYDLASFREYNPGDDIRRIVWKYYAKTRRLIVRVDYGETRPRILLLIDVRREDWEIGEPPNTLAQIQLRQARSILEYLLKTSGRIDVAMCTGDVPKIRLDVTGDPVEVLYDFLSVTPAGAGCNSPLGIYGKIPDYTGRSPDEYDAVILVTNPLTIKREGVGSINNLIKSYPGKLVLLIPNYNYLQYFEVEAEFKKILWETARLIEKGGRGIIVPEESMIYMGALE